LCTLVLIEGEVPRQEISRELRNIEVLVWVEGPEGW
jgi:hypothetical protein